MSSSSQGLLLCWRLVHSFNSFVQEETKCRHHGNKLEVWCIDCQELMCATCVLVAHRSHHVKLLEEYGDNAKRELKEAMGEANQLYLNVVKDGDDLERNIDYMEKVLSFIFVDCSLYSSHLGYPFSLL